VSSNAEYKEPHYNITKQLHGMTVVHILQSQQKGLSPDVYTKSTAPQVKM